MLNVIALQGRLVADPTLRQTTAGKSVATFRIACDRNRKGPDGQTQADFIDVVVWEHTAEFVCRYFRKGNMIAVEGRLQTRNFTDKNGVNKTAVEVVANNVAFCGPRPQAQQEPTVQPTAEESSNVGGYSPGANPDFCLVFDEGDLPFDKAPC